MEREPKYKGKELDTLRMEERQLRVMLDIANELAAIQEALWEINERLKK